MDDIKEIIARHIDPSAWDVAEFDGESNGGVSESLNSAEDIMAALKAAGYAVVPVEPNENIQRAGAEASIIGGDSELMLLNAADMYRAMIAAAGEQT